MTEQVQQAILDLPELAWTPAVDADGELREGAEVAERTGMLPDPTAAGWPDRMRVIVRRERPHPGAQLSFTDLHGWRFQAFATDTAAGHLSEAGPNSPHYIRTLAELLALWRSRMNNQDMGEFTDYVKTRPALQELVKGLARTRRSCRCSHHQHDQPKTITKIATVPERRRRGWRTRQLG